MTTWTPTRDPGVAWLLGSDEPVIRWRALTGLADRPETDPEVRAARRAISEGRIVRALTAGREQSGGSGIHPYGKWGGGHWRLVSLMDLGVPPDAVDPGEAIDRVFDWLLSPGHVRGVKVIDGLARRCGSQEGNALAVAVHFGLADDDRVRQLARNLIGWQWPDGGWNCDRRPGVRVTHSSVNESLPPLRGLWAWATATGDGDGRLAADRAAAFFLRHRLLWSERSGEPIHPDVLRIHYPPYWHYDLLAALRVFAETGLITDRRCQDALDLLRSKRTVDGWWTTEGSHFRKPGSKGSGVEVADWGPRNEPSEPATLGALLVLRAAGRLTGDA